MDTPEIRKTTSSAGRKAYWIVNIITEVIPGGI
jgi:hypothetical protein